MKPRVILAIGWLGFLAYAYPGYMSYDSILQLGEARSGVYGGAHPPLMSMLWALLDSIIAGPLLMLVLQSSCFLAGCFLLLRRWLSERCAALAAVGVLWFPAVAAIMAVIWKDSQMAGFLVLGAALVLSPRRGVRIGGLALLALATGMRYNALAITLPLIVLLFEWSAAQRWWQRYPLALAAWLLVTVVPTVLNRQMTSDQSSTWHRTLALSDIVGTLRYAPDLSDAELQPLLAGTPLRTPTAIQQQTRSDLPPDGISEHDLLSFGTGTYVPALWITTFQVFALPDTDEQRAALTRAWKAIVLGHPLAYLTYRWHVFRELVHLGDADIPSGAYVWFTDVLDPSGSAHAIGHNATPSKLQTHLHTAMRWLGTSWLFRGWLYLALTLVLLPFCRRDRVLAALALSGLANEALLYLVAPTIDFRYSFWLVVSTLLVIVGVIARRASASTK